MIRLLKDKLHWVSLVGAGAVLGFALFYTSLPGAEGDLICGEGMFYDPAHQICAPFPVPPPPGTLYCTTGECLIIGPSQEARP